VFHSNSVPNLHLFWNITSFWPEITDLNLPQFYLVSLLGVTLSEFRRDFWHQKSLWAIVLRCLRDLTFSRFGTIPACDRRERQTEGRTHNDSIYRASIASRGKNRVRASLSTTVVHNTVLIIFPLVLQTVVIAPMF